MTVQEIANVTGPAQTPTTNGEQKPSNWIPLKDETLHARRKTKVICIGAGYFGLTLSHKIKHEHKLEDDVDFTIYEKNDEVGGTWYENCYPGVACDIPIHGYSFPFEPSPDFSAYYAPGPEIHAYLKRTSDKWRLADKVQFQSRVLSATWDEKAGLWRLVIQQGDRTKTDSCNVLVNGSGVLNKWKWPSIEGLSDFKGKLMHTAKWDQTCEWEGKRIAVIGNGSSGIQVTAAIAEKASKLVNYVRTPTWVSINLVPDSEHEGKNFLYSEEQKQKFRDDPAEFYKYREGLEQSINSVYFLLLNGHPAAEGVAAVCDAQMRERLKYDPSLAEKLIPSFRPGCRRLTPGDGYLEAFEQDHCTMCWDAIERVTEKGIQTGQGEEEFDIIIAATGFDTSFIPSFEVKGRNGVTLAERWAKEPDAFFSVQASGMPNFFIFNGPNGNISHGSMVANMGFVSEYILRWTEKLATEDIKSIDVKQQSSDDYNVYNQELLQLTSFADTCKSWYKNNKETGNITAAYGGSFMHLLECLRTIGAEHFDFTYNSANRFRFMGNGQSSIDKMGAGFLTGYMEAAEETRKRLEKALVDGSGDGGNVVKV